MFVDYSGLERYTDINASFGKLVNTYCCFQRCEAISEQLEILKSLVPKCHDIVALTDEDFASGHTAGLTQKLFAMGDDPTPDHRLYRPPAEMQHHNTHRDRQPG